MEMWERCSSSDNGVHLREQGIKISDIRKAATEHECVFARVNVKDAASKPALLAKLARALKFPAYFGMNWDALEDSLRDLSWNRAAGYVVVLTGFSIMAEKIPAEAEIIKKIFESSAKYWQGKQVPFFIFLE